MGVASWSFDLAQAVEWVWAGWVLALRKAGQPTVSRGFVLAGGVGLSGDWCRKHACRASASCLCGEWGVVGAPACVGVACCRGSGAVRPGCLTCLGLLVVGGCGWVWVGWL